MSPDPFSALQLPATFLGLQHVVQGRSGLDLSLFVAGPLKRHDGGLFGGGGVKHQSDRSGFNVEFGPGGFLSPEVLDLGYLKCLDTGCCFGRWLTALDVDSGRVWQVDEQGESRR